MSQAGQSASPSKHVRSIILSLAFIGLVAFGLLVAGYNLLNPHSATTKQPQVLTSTQNILNTQTFTSYAVVTSPVTITSTQAAAGYGYATPGPAYGYCGPYGCYNSNSNYPAYYSCYVTGDSNMLHCSYRYYYSPYQGYYPGYNTNYNVCRTVGSDTVQCSGYFNQDSNGCVELAIPIDYGDFDTFYQYYTLHNLYSSYPPGSWVTVTGQMYQGYNSSPSGAACPSTYINVISMS